MPRCTMLCRATPRRAVVYTAAPTEEDLKREMEEAMEDGELDGGPTEEERPASPGAFVWKDKERQIPASPDNAGDNP